MASIPRWVFSEVVGLGKDQFWKMKQSLISGPRAVWRVTECLAAGLRAAINFRFGECLLVLPMASILERLIDRKSCGWREGGRSHNFISIAVNTLMKVDSGEESYISFGS